MTQEKPTFGQKGLQPHEVRVVEERKELMDKVTKLHTFMNSDFYKTLDEESKKNLEIQEGLMKNYADILLQRIERFEGKIENTIIELTFGQKAVGLTFNPSGNDKVGKAKQLMADAIDLLEDHHAEIMMKDPNVNTWIRAVLRKAAFNAIISAQMTLVKYLTWKY